MRRLPATNAAASPRKIAASGQSENPEATGGLAGLQRVELWGQAPALGVAGDGAEIPDSEFVEALLVPTPRRGATATSPNARMPTPTTRCSQRLMA
ncbi:MAG: hypothetical protein QOJ44_974 [Acidimicrobiaceae bacterium]|jgi:hypothetical protein|nr:hypothetical protein [Acidimicrobiaceae bacterium]